MSRQATAVLSMGVLISGAVAEYRFVTPLGAQAGAGVNTAGVCQMAAVDKDVATVTMLGSSIVEAGAAIAAGSLVETDASGRAITHVSGAVVARLAPGQSASAAGQFVEVILIPN